jgi:Ca2+-binding EF-hand superfamily protein
MKTPTLLLACVACIAIPVLAATPQGRGAPAQKGPVAQVSSAAKERALEEQRELAGKYFQIADYDRNEWISFREARDSLGVDRNRYLVYDADRDGRVTLEEFTAVSLETAKRYGVFKAPTPSPDDPEAQALLDSLLQGPAEEEEEDVAPFPTDAKSVQELFGRVRPRVARENAVPEPDQLVGPVSSFRRLDFDDDGGIALADLELLLAGSGLDVRPRALIAALDTDANQRVSEAEFYASMSAVER